MTGHRVLIQVDLKSTEEGGLNGKIVAGHRSVAYQFDGLGQEEQDQAFAALVESVVEGGEPGSRMVADIRFIHELAEVYAAPGTTVRLIHGRVVGSGVVLEVLPQVSAAVDDPPLR